MDWRFDMVGCLDISWALGMVWRAALWIAELGEAFWSFALSAG
jgi:hypothetical protein